MLSSAVQDARFGLAVLRRSPGFAAVAVTSLALGIGAVIALFGAVRIALLDDLNVYEPQDLRLVYWSAPRDLALSQYNSGGFTDPSTKRRYRTNYSYPAFRTLQAAAPERLFGFNFLTRLTVAADGQPPIAITGLLVSGNAFSVLQPPIALGRGLIPADDDVAAPPAAVLTDECWRTSFGADPDVVGRIVRINGAPFTIAGVTGPGFRGLSTGGGNSPLADVILPLAAQPAVWVAPGGPSLSATDVLWVRAMIRMPAGDAGRTAQQLSAALRGALLETGVLTTSEAADADLRLRPGRRGIDPIGPAADRPLRILAAAVAVVLLIACVNVAALLLARGVGRHREIAVRQALGAGRLRLIRQLAVESAVLALCGGAGGLLLASWARPIISAMLTAGLSVPPTTMAIDGSTMGIALAATAATALLFGLLPAFRLTGGELIVHLRQHMAAAAAPRLRLVRGLLAVQIGVSLPLVALALLLVRTLVNLSAVELGFDPRGLLIVRADPTIARGPGSAPDPREVETLSRRLLQRLEMVPGVTSATLVENALLGGFTSNNWMDVDGQRAMIYMNGIGPKYFETFGVPLVAGRAPDLNDRAGGPFVAVINETAARRFFGPASPIGRHFTMGTRRYEVIGVSADSKYGDLRREVEPTMMDPWVQRAGGRAMNVVIRARVVDEPLKEAVRQAIADVMPDVPLTQMRTQMEQIARGTGRERLLARLMTFFAGFVLLLACVGLYSATSYAVAMRTSEIGVRMALGARRSQVVWMVLRSVLALAGIGLVLGSAAAWFAGPLAGSMLFRVDPHDGGTIVAAVLLMLVVSVTAAAVPAARAARIEPLLALRRE